MTLLPETRTELPPVQMFDRHACPQCGALLFAPDVSEFVGHGRVRHLWACEDCGRAIVTCTVLMNGRLRSRVLA